MPDLRTEQELNDRMRRVRPRRRNRRRPPTDDGRRPRSCQRRYVAGRPFAWLQSFRRAATRFEVERRLDDACVAMACAFVALGEW